MNSTKRTKLLIEANSNKKLRLSFMISGVFLQNYLTKFQKPIIFYLNIYNYVSLKFYFYGKFK